MDLLLSAFLLPDTCENFNKGSYDWSFQAEEKPTNYALMAFSSSSSSSDNEVVTCLKACTKAYAQFKSHYDKLTADYRKSQFDVISYQTCLESVEAKLLVYQQNESVFEKDIKLLKLEVQLRDNALVIFRQNLEKAEQEKDYLKLKLEKFLTYDRYQSGNGYHAVPPPYTGLGYNSQVFTRAMFDCDDYFSSGSDESLPPSLIYDRLLVQHVETSILDVTHRTAIPKPKSQGKIRNRKACFVYKSLDHLIKDSVTQVDAVRPVTTDVPKTRVTRPRQAKSVVTKPNSPPRRHINRSPSPKVSNFPPKVTAVKAPMVNAAQGGQGKWFNTHKDAKTLMEAIEKRFGGNTETKTVQTTLMKQQYENFTCSSSESLDQIHDRLQKLISQLEILGVSLLQEDINLKFLRSLPFEWRTHTLIWRNKTDLEEQSLDDLFNSLKIYEAEVKSSSSAGLGYNSQVFTRAMFDCDDYFSSGSDESLPPSPIYDRLLVQYVETSILDVTHRTTIPKPKSQGKIRNRKACFVYKSLDHLIKDSVTQVNAVRPVTTDVPKTRVTRPRQAKSVVTKPNSPPRRHINRSPSPKVSNFPPKVTAVKALMVNAAQGGHGKWRDQKSGDNNSMVKMGSKAADYSIHDNKVMLGAMGSSQDSRQCFDYCLVFPTFFGGFLHLASSMQLAVVVFVAALAPEFVLGFALLESGLSQLDLQSAPLGLQLVSAQVFVESVVLQLESALVHLESILVHLAI
uniref:Uncharacterized protein n=1 Tax=Tanacetum cinerariifolium TaxID=118510 RepID=A0A6L2ND60_TANCI|nr:hypothetical protein [Tanacetum cinerariifolium]